MRSFLFTISDFMETQAGHLLLLTTLWYTLPLMPGGGEYQKEVFGAILYALRGQIVNGRNS